jgi:hypothetical protein
MSLKAALYTYLTGNAGVAALVEDRIYPSFTGSMAAALPRVCYEIDRTTVERHLSGLTDITMASVSFQCWAEDSTGADGLAQTVRQALDAYKGTQSGVDILTVFYDSETDTIEVPDDGGSLPTYLRTITFRVWHRRTL